MRLIVRIWKASVIRQWFIDFQQLNSWLLQHFWSITKNTSLNKYKILSSSSHNRHLTSRWEVYIENKRRMAIKYLWYLFHFNWEHSFLTELYRSHVDTIQSVWRIGWQNDYKIELSILFYSMFILYFRL